MGLTRRKMNSHAKTGSTKSYSYNGSSYSNREWWSSYVKFHEQTDEDYSVYKLPVRWLKLMPGCGIQSKVCFASTHFFIYWYNAAYFRTE